MSNEKLLSEKLADERMPIAAAAEVLLTLSASCSPAYSGGRYVGGSAALLAASMVGFAVGPSLGPSVARRRQKRSDRG